MVGTMCCVSSCRSNSLRNRLNGEKILFFRFPNEPKTKKEWIRRCNKEMGWNTKNKRVCHKHFTDDDYEDYVRGRLSSVRPKQLKSTAVPSINLGLGANRKKKPQFKTHKRKVQQTRNFRTRTRKPDNPQDSTVIDSDIEIVESVKKKAKKSRKLSTSESSNIPHDVTIIDSDIEIVEDVPLLHFNNNTENDRKRKRKQEIQVLEEFPAKIKEKIVIEIVPANIDDSTISQLQNKYDELLEEHEILQKDYQQAEYALLNVNEENVNLQQKLKNYKKNLKSSVKQVLNSILDSYEFEDLIEEKCKSIIN